MLDLTKGLRSGIFDLPSQPMKPAVPTMLTEFVDLYDTATG